VLNILISLMAAYCFFDMYEVTDSEKLEQYRSGVLATVKRYGGKYVLVGGKWDIVEGNWRPTFPVLIEFPTLKAAHRWYNSQEYAPLKALRLSGTKNNVVFMESETSPFTSAK
jgi:uncharacterized protein (DUF1330 family)